MKLPRPFGRISIAVRSAAAMLLCLGGASSVVHAQAVIPLVSLPVERAYPLNQHECDGQSTRLSRDGRYIVFASPCRLLPDLVTLDARLWRYDVNTKSFALVFDAGVVPKPPNGSNGTLDYSIDATGQLVAIASSNSALVVGDANAAEDVFLRDLASGITTRISVRSDAVEADGSSYFPTVSGDGNSILFLTRATNLTETPVPSGGGQWVLADRLDGSLVAVVTMSESDLGPFRFAYPRAYGVSHSGDLLVLDVPPLTTGPGQLERTIAYLRPAASAAFALCTDSAGVPIGDYCAYSGMSADGHRIGFTATTAQQHQQYVKDTQTGTTLSVGGVFPLDPPTEMQFAADGSAVVFEDPVDAGAGIWCALVSRAFETGLERQLLIGRAPDPGALGVNCMARFSLSDDHRVIALDTSDELVPPAAPYFGFTGRRLFLGAGDWMHRDSFE